MIAALQFLTRPRVLALQAVVLAFACVVFAWLIFQLRALSGGYGILDMAFGYSADEVSKTFAAYGEHGRALYRQIALVDAVYPVIYSLFFASVLIVLLPAGRRRWLVLLPFAVAALDYVENYHLYVLLVSFPALDPDVVQTASTATRLKHLGLVILFALIAVLARAWWRRRAGGTHAET